MKISVSVKPRSSAQSIEQVADQYIVRVTAAPTDGEANEQVVHVLAKHFNIAPSLVAIVKGHTAKHKIIEIDL